MPSITLQTTPGLTLVARAEPPWRFPGNGFHGRPADVGAEALSQANPIWTLTETPQTARVSEYSATVDYVTCEWAGCVLDNRFNPVPGSFRTTGPSRFLDRRLPGIT